MTGGKGLLLAIDTANERCSAALLRLEDGALAACREEEIGRGHAERLMDVVGETLIEAGAGWADIGKLAVSIGPGSFTGIRVGVAAVRGLEISLGVPAIGVSTLEALAEPEWREAPVLAVHDARRGELYAALFAKGGAMLAEPAALAPDGLAAFAAVGTAPVRLVGTGAAIALEVLGGERAVLLPERRFASVAAIARLAAERDAEGSPMPLYLRGADARAQAPAGLRASAGAASRRPQPAGS